MGWDGEEGWWFRGGMPGVVTEKERGENEYSKHCFNLKQRCFQENAFQWS